MVRIALTVAAFLSLLVFVMLVLRYELDLSTVVAGMLSVSVMAVGLMLAIALQHFAGLSAIVTSMILGGAIFLMALAYEVAT